MRRSDRIAFICLGVGVAAILGMIQVVSMLQKPSPTPGDMCPHDPDGAARQVSLRLAPYRGPGPHPIVTVGASGFDESSGLPTSWTAAGDDTSRVQLVACEYQQATSARTAKTCEYQLSDPSEERMTVTLLATTYSVRLYEASTGRRIAALQVPGNPDCALMTYTDVDGHGKPPTGQTSVEGVDSKALVDALRPYVEHAR